MNINKPLSFFDKICDDDEKQEKANTFCLYHTNFQFCEIATEEEKEILIPIYAAYDFWNFFNQLIKAKEIITQEMIDQDRIFYNDFITKYNKLDLHGKTIVMMEKRPLIKYTLEELRKLIPTVQYWHLLYYLMYKHE